MKLLRLMAVASAAVALAASPAAAAPVHHPPIGVVPADLRNPDLREGHVVPVPYSPQPTASVAAPRIVTTTAGGFGWRSAAIGAGIFAAIATLLWLTASRRMRAPTAR